MWTPSSKTTASTASFSPPQAVRLGETPGCCSTFSELQGQEEKPQQQSALPHHHPLFPPPQAARPGEAPASVSVPTLSKLKSQVRYDYKQLAARPKLHLVPVC